MGATLILVPVVISAWPAFSAAVLAAAASLGYQVGAVGAEGSRAAMQLRKSPVNLEIERSELVTGQLGRDQHLTVSRDGVTVTFSRDARGKAALSVVGEQYDRATLQTLGEELSKAVVQKYVYQKITDEMRSRGFVVVEEETTQERAIHLKVRHWEG